MITPRSLPDFLAERPSLAGALLAGFPAGVAHFDREGRLDASNAELAQILGGLPAAAADLDLRPLGGADEAPEHAPEHAPVPGRGISPITRAAAGEAVRGADFELPRSDGSVRLVRLSALPSEEDGRSDGGVWVTIVDLGERKSLDLLRSQVLGVVAHDLRNPLSAMRMTLAMLVKKTEVPSERRIALAERMQGTLARMEALVSSLVEQAQIDAGGELTLKREPQNLGDLYERVERDLQLLFPNRQIEVERRGSLEGTWDTARMERVLTNLLTNAFKHGRDDRPVRLLLDGEGESNIQLTVHNEGPPIAPQLLPVVFEPFSIGGDRQERRRSIGLGLFIVKHLIRAHGGEVTVDSGEAGTTFTVSLPRSEGARSQTRSAGGRETGPTGRFGST
jgi:signal transduction histidine kinase